MVMAKHFNTEYQNQFGDYGIDDEESERLEHVL